jgi:hypothetical protein
MGNRDSFFSGKGGQGDERKKIGTVGISLFVLCPFGGLQYFPGEAAEEGLLK